MDSRVTTYLETLDIDVMQSSALFHLLANGDFAEAAASDIVRDGNSGSALYLHESQCTLLRCTPRRVQVQLTWLHSPLRLNMVPGYSMTCMASGPAHRLAPFFDLLLISIDQYSTVQYSTVQYRWAIANTRLFSII